MASCFRHTEREREREREEKNRVWKFCIIEHGGTYLYPANSRINPKARGLWILGWAGLHSKTLPQKPVGSGLNQQ